MADTQSHDLLVAYDDTAVAHRAAEFAAERAAKTGESVDIVHIGTDLTEQELQDAVGAVFDQQNVVARFQTINRGGSENENVSVNAILSNLIDSQGYDLVFIGNEKHGLFHNLTEESVSKGLIEDQIVPVVLVP